MKKSKKTSERIEIRETYAAIPTPEGDAVAERVALQVPMKWDPELKKWLLTPEAIELLEAAKSRHMGLMQPQELLALRERLRLTQGELGELLKIGAKSWTRWESGRQRPSQSINLLLRLLDTGIVSPQQLAQIGAPRADWSRQFQLIAESNLAEPSVSLDLCRSNQSSTAAPFEALRLPA